MKFRLKESVGYTYFPDDPELYGYDLELNPSEIYDELTENFSINEIADILVDYKYLTQEDISEEDDLDYVISDCIKFNMSIYDLLGIAEFREIVEDYITNEESQLLSDIKDDKIFRSTHGPEI